MTENTAETPFTATQLLRTKEALRIARQHNIHAHHRLGNNFGVDLLGPLGAVSHALNHNNTRTAKRILGDLIAMLIAGRIGMAQTVVEEMQFRDSRKSMLNQANKILREATRTQRTD